MATKASKLKKSSLKTKRPTKARRAKTSRQKESFISRKRKLIISLSAALVVVLVGAYVLASRAATSYVAFVGIGGKCLDNSGQRKVNDNKIQLYACNTTSAQKWQVNSNGTITNANGYCLDVRHRGTKPGTLVQLYECNGTPAQKWTITKVKNSSANTIVNPHSGLCLDDKYAKIEDGNQIWMWTCNGTDAQKWTTKKFTAPPTKPPTTPPSTPPSTPPTTPPTSGTRKHFIQNSRPSEAKTLQALGYNIIDANPGDIDAINKLPSGMQAMVWVGGAMCENFSYSFGSFKDFVYKNRNNNKIYGYFLYDEPNTKSCNFYDKKGSDDDIKGRADYIHCLSNDAAKVNAAGQCVENGKVVANRTDKKAYIVDEYSYNYAQVRQSVTHVDIFAIDPYPCRPSGCSYSGGSDQFRERIAKAKKYFPEANIAPTYQAFGGDGWKMPTAAQLRTIQAEFDKGLKGTVLDVTYTWRRNTGGQNGALNESSSLQQVIKEHNAKY